MTDIHTTAGDSKIETAHVQPTPAGPVFPARAEPSARIEVPPQAAAELIRTEFVEASAISAEQRHRCDYVTKILLALTAPVTVVNVFLVETLLRKHGVLGHNRRHWPKQIIVDGNPVVVGNEAEEKAARLPAPVAPVPKPVAAFPPHIAEIEARGQRTEALAVVIRAALNKPPAPRMTVNADNELPLGWPDDVQVMHVDIEGSNIRPPDIVPLVNNLAGILEHNGVTPADITEIVHGPVTTADGRDRYVVVAGYKPIASPLVAPKEPVL